jgi:DNA anti-recombination protein RmuC
MDVPQGGEEPDVLLDVNELEVDKLSLEVDDLRAHVSLMAELANLLRLSVGVDATLAGVKLEIEGVEANVLLKVRLEHVRAILEKALDTIAAQPEILQTLSQTLSEAVRESLGEAQTTLSEVLDELQVGATVDEALRGRLQTVRATLGEVLQGREVVGGGEEAGPRALDNESARDAPTPGAEEE